MSIKSNDSLINKLHLFTRHLPASSTLFSVLFLLSMGTGIASVALTNYHQIARSIGPILAGGILSGMLVILIPTLLTVMIIKLFRRDVKVKYVLFVALVGAMVYSLFIILASAIYQIMGNYTLSNAIVLAGDASIYGWWFFVNKVLLGQKKKAVLFAIIQPLFNILVYLAASGLIFTFSVPLNVLLIKLFAGIFIFMIISYMILYIFDSPLKKNLGFGGIDAFSQVVQNWLFDLDIMVQSPLGGGNFGINSDVEVQTLLFRKSNRAIKTILFAPFLHYGPVGVMGGSNFPYLLERHSITKYNAPLFAMHCAVNEDNNPISNSQINKLKEILDKSIKTANKVNVSTGISYTEGRHNNAMVSILNIGNVGIATFTRAPYVTEDIAPESTMLFKEFLNNKIENPILIDAHNSRYESAPEEELQGVKPNSIYMKEYMAAIKNIGKPKHTSRKFKVGVGSVDIYAPLNNPTDIAPGNLNVIIFAFNGYKHAIVQFNANNVLPNIRNAIVKHIKKSYKIDAEVYTTDTHFVNSLEKNASNVMGRETKLNKLMPLIDRAVIRALSDIEAVDVYYKRDYMKNFKIWGPDVREKAYAVVTSVMGLARILVPVIVAGGFIVASWIISLV